MNAPYRRTAANLAVLRLMFEIEFAREKLR